MNRPKGVVLLFVLGLSGIIAVVIVTLLIHLRAQVSRQELWLDRIRAYYLCQTGLSVAMLDLSAGRVPTLIPGRSYVKHFTFYMGPRAYEVNYQITNQGGKRVFSVSVPSPCGLRYTYYLGAVGRRAFPIFIRGKL